MGEKGPASAEQLPMDLEIRAVAARLGYEEPFEVTEMLRKRKPEDNEQEITKAFNDKLEDLKENVYTNDPKFLAYISLARAAADVQSAYNNLLDAKAVLDNQEENPEVADELGQIMDRL